MIALQPLLLPAPSTGKPTLPKQIVSASLLLLTLLLYGCASNAPWKQQAFALTAPAAEAGPSSHTNVLSLRRVTVSPLFEDKALIYRTAENRYERDPYAAFLVSPGQMLTENLRLYLRAGRAFMVPETDSGLPASCCMAVAVNQLYGDFRQADQPFAVLQLHFLLYSTQPTDYGRVLWQQDYGKRLPMPHRTAATLIAGWNTGLREIMDQVNSELNHLAIPETTGR